MNQGLDPLSVDRMTEVWIPTEITFISDQNYDNSPTEALANAPYVRFVNENSGKELTLSSFWDGGDIFRVRFAPTETGVWKFFTVCEKDASLDGLTGSVGAVKYRGENEIYKHGFVKSNGNKYFVYDDGTPFFFLGDTHWNFLMEEFDEKGDHAGNVNTDSHFRYIVDKRVAQGFTVYESEPIGAPFSLAKGFTRETVEGFKKADRYFAYIASKGLVHTNAQFFFAAEMRGDVINFEYLELISRYWVARFGAYPVMWTLAQEIDDDFYWTQENADNGKHPGWTVANNPWVEVAKFIHKYDAYSHPLTGHQEGSTDVQAENSVFTKEDDSVTGHDWFGAQWKPSFASNDLGSTKRKDYSILDAAKEFWQSKKITVNYEGRYVNLWTNDFGGRAQGWISYLCGMFGYGYGAADIWLYKGTYDLDKDTVRYDGISTITVEMKNKKWDEAVEFPSAYQVGYMREYFESFEWWKMIPDFYNGERFKCDDGAIGVCAVVPGERRIVYLYNPSNGSGMFTGLEKDAKYVLEWLDPQTGRKTSDTVTANAVDENGQPAYKLEKRPDENDWVVTLIECHR